MNRIDELKKTYESAAAECADLALRVPVNEQLAIQNKTRMNLSPDGVKLRDALEAKRTASHALQEAAAALAAEASAMLAQADQIAAACQSVIRGESCELPAWPAAPVAQKPGRRPAHVGE